MVMKCNNRSKISVERIAELHPERDDLHEVRVKVCEEFLKAIRDMKSNELECYLVNAGSVLYEVAFGMEFKIPRKWG